MPGRRRETAAAEGRLGPRHTDTPHSVACHVGECVSARNADIPVIGSDVDGTASTGSPALVPAQPTSSRPKPLDQRHASYARDVWPPPGAIGRYVAGLGEPAPHLDMEWHMKRLRQWCCVSQSSLELSSGLTLQPTKSDCELTLPWRESLLLWRDHQWHRPPSKR